MFDSNLFGALLKQLRQEKELSLRELANKAGLAHTYLRNIENGIKPPPSDALLKKLVNVLCLDSETKTTFYDLAAQCKQIKDDKNIYLPIDVSNHLSKTEEARLVIRKIENLEDSNEFWNKILKQFE